MPKGRKPKINRLTAQQIQTLQRIPTQQAQLTKKRPTIQNPSSTVKKQKLKLAQKDQKQPRKKSATISIPGYSSFIQSSSTRHYRFGKTLFVTRSSLLDNAVKTSFINKGLYSGFHPMFLVIALLFIVNRVVHNYDKTGTLVDLKMLKEAVEHWGFLLLSYALTHLWAFTQALIFFNIVLRAYILQKIIICGVNIKIVRIIQHVTQSGLFATALIIVFQRDFYVTAALFIGINCIVYYFKMHSYTETNYNMRKEYLKKKADGDQIEPHQYPNNINLRNFIDYLFTPTCVYQAEYPKKKSIDWLYILNKFILMIILAAVMYINIIDYILPVINEARSNPYNIDHFMIFLQLLIPINILWFSSFLLIFDTIANMFGQLTRFGDRQFYQDFWNASTIGQYFRKNNRIFHQFFYRHIYVDLMMSYKIKEDVAKLMTFFFSAALFEFIMVLIFKFIYPYILFFFCLAPIANIILRCIIKEQKLGNLFLLTVILLFNPGIVTLYITHDIQLSLQR